MNADATTDGTPVRPLLRYGVAEARKPLKWHDYLAAIGEHDAEGRICARYLYGQRFDLNG